MPTTLDLSGLDRLTERFRKLVNVDATPLMVTWEANIIKDNRDGVLAGLDKNGLPLIPVTYRPKPPTQKRLTAAQKNLAPGARARRGAFAGFGQHPAGLNNNLTTAEYQRLTGPPLAPRGAFSRVITNLKTGHELGLNPRTGATTWQAVGVWFEIVNRKGLKFMHYHFEGIGQKLRDLRGVRPVGIERCKKAARAFMISEIRRSG